MPNRSRTGTTAPPDDETLSPRALWMNEVTGSLERLAGRADLQEASIRQVQLELRSLTETQGQVRTLLQKIAEAEAARTEAIVAAKEQTGEHERRRLDWLRTVFDSPAVQSGMKTVFTLIALFLAQFLGIAYLLPKGPP